MRFQGLGLLTAFSMLAQNAPQALGPADVAARTNSSLAVVLAGKSPNQPAVTAVAIAIRQNGVLLTPYHLIKDARAVQVRLSNGETFDRVQLLGVDERRDVAAIKITGSPPALPSAGAGNTAAGDLLTVVSWSPVAAWTTSQGAVSAYAMADQVPGAGQGHRLIRFTVAGQAPPNTGVLVTARGDALGLVTGGGFAIPLESVQGLADERPGKIFGAGTSLRLPETAAVRPPSPVAARAAPVTAKRESNPAAGPAKPKEDRASLLRSLKAIYVDTTASTALGSDEMKQALRDNPSLRFLGIQVVDQENQADGILALDRAHAGDYPFEVRSPNGTVLLRGRGIGLSSSAGARDVAKYVVQLIRPFRPERSQ